MAVIEAFLSAAAVAELEAAGSRPGGMLANRIATFAAADPPPGLHLLYAAHWCAACEVFEHEGVPALIVYAVRKRGELLELLVGADVAAATRALAVRAALRQSPRPVAPRV